MEQIKVYNFKLRHVLAIIFFISFSIIATLEFSKYQIILVYLLMALVLAFELKRLLLPILIIDSKKINLPIENESVFWENIVKIEYHNKFKIEIKVKEIDSNRKKYNVPYVFDDYDDEVGYRDYSIYYIDIKFVKMNQDILYKIILDLSKMEENERENQIKNIKKTLPLS